MDYSPKGPLSMGFSRQECWNGLPFPPLGDLPNPGTEPTSLESPALAGGYFTIEPPVGPYSKKTRWRSGDRASDVAGNEVSCKWRTMSAVIKIRLILSPRYSIDLPMKYHLFLNFVNDIFYCLLLSTKWKAKVYNFQTAL